MHWRPDLLLVSYCTVAVSFDRASDSNHPPHTSLHATRSNNKLHPPQGAGLVHLGARGSRAPTSTGNIQYRANCTIVSPEMSVISGHTHIFSYVAYKKIFRKFYFIPWPLLMIALSSVDRLQWLLGIYHDLIYAFMLNKKHIATWVWSLQLYSKWVNIVYTHMQASYYINLVMQLSLIDKRVFIFMSI